MVTFLAVLACVFAVGGVFVAAIKETGSPTPAGTGQPTELDEDLEAEIDNFEGTPHKNF